MDQVKIKKKIRAFCVFMRRYIFAPAQAIVTIATIFVIIKTNTITNTANLLQIVDFIQQRTDIVSAVDLKSREDKISSDNSGIIDARQVASRNAERWAAIASLLNAYEFACAQYLSNKIDKEAFKVFYYGMIKTIKNDYSSHFADIDGREPYQAINDVYTEWYGR